MKEHVLAEIPMPNHQQPTHSGSYEDLNKEDPITFVGTCFDDFRFTDIPEPTPNYRDISETHKLNVRGESYLADKVKVLRQPLV